MKTNVSNTSITTECIKQYVSKAVNVNEWEPEECDGTYSILQRAVMAAIGLQSVRKLWNTEARSYAVVNLTEYTLAIYGSLLEPEKMISLYNIISGQSDIAYQTHKEILPYPQTKDVYRYIEVISETGKIR